MLIALVLALAGVAAGCGDGDGDGSRPADGRPCPDPPASVAPPTLPDGIPWPDGAVATEVRDDADVRIVVGYTRGPLDEALDRFRSAIEGRSLLTLGAAEGDDDRTSLAVGGPSSQGTLTLSAGCERTDVRLELRPLVGG